MEILRNHFDRTWVLFLSGWVLLGCSTVTESKRSIATEDTPSIELPAGSLTCRSVERVAGHERQDCEITTPRGKKVFHVVKLSGDDFEGNAYFHGRLLAREIGEGSLLEALDNIRQVEKMIKIKDPKKKKKVTDAVMGVYGCYERRMLSSLSPEFSRAVRLLYGGYRDGNRGKVRVTESDFVRATLSIEMGNFLTGLLERSKTGLFGKVGLALDVVAECGGAAIDEFLKDEEIRESVSAAAAIYQTQERGKFACTGLVATGPWSREGRLIHGRNLEQTPMINSWNRHPVIYLMNEKGHYKYVAFGTAGIIFPGGISGMNEKGISVSLHQMNSEKVASKHEPGSAAMMPYLQQRILAEASSIDEAIALVRKTKAFSSWTILVSDAKTNEVASIEIGSERNVVAHRSKGRYFSQANVFLSKEMQDDHFHSKYNNWLENHSRLRIADREFGRAQGRVDVDWMLRVLASHEDAFEGEERAFGRSIARASNIMTSIVVPKASGGGQIWMTVGDQLPPNHGYYAGFEIDFDRMEASPLGAKKTGLFRGRPSYEQSIEEYDYAYIANHNGQDSEAIRRIERAMELASNEGIDEPVYRYIYARLMMKKSNWTAAYSHLLALDSSSERFHPLRRANIGMYLMFVGDQIGGAAVENETLRKRRYEFAKGVLKSIRKSKNSAQDRYYPGLHGVLHAKNDLDSKEALWEKIYQKEKVKLPDVDMSTVD